MAKPLGELPPEKAATGHRFTLKGDMTWDLPADLLATLTRAHPAKDLSGELDRAAAWLSCNPAKRKTAQGMPRFLNGWLRRADPTSLPSKPTLFSVLPPEPDDYREDADLRYRPSSFRTTATP